MEGMNVLPPGFRFHPTDDELINDYLKKKISTCSNPFVSIIAEIDLYRFNPWELPGQAYFGEKEWFFFSQRDKKYPNGARPNRAAASGYWKATGTDKPILSRSSQCIGLKKALVFYEGRAPKCNKTNWMMYEYRLLDTNSNHHLTPTGIMRLDDWVLCRVRQKTVPANKPKQEGNVKKKAKRGYEDMFDEYMEDEYSAQNISFLQQNNNEWQPQQHCYQQSDQTLMIDFEDQGTSSSHSFSQDTYDSPLTATNSTMDDALEGIRRVLLDEYTPQQPNKRHCSANSLAFVSDNSCNFHIAPN